MAKKRIQRTDRLFEETKAVTSIFAQESERVRHSVSTHRLVPNQFNPRQAYSRETLEELARSMREYGFIGALDGRQLSDGRVELAYGSRRLLAAKMAHIQTVPVFLHDWDDDQMRFMCLVENLTHEDLTPIDEAAAVGRMRDELGLSTREISHRASKPRSWVRDRLALFDAPPADDLSTSVRPSQSPAPDSTQVFEQEVPFKGRLATVQQAVPSLWEAQAGARPPTPTTGTSRAPDGGWVAAGSPLIVLAIEALDTFNPDVLSDDEMEEAINWLRQLASRTNLLLQDLEERL